MKFRTSRAAGLTAAALAGALSIPAAAAAYAEPGVAQAVGDPVVSIVSGPPALSNEGAVTFTFTATDDTDTSLDLTCALDGVPVTPCDPDGTTIDPVGEGTQTFVVTATDDVPQSGSDQATFEIDQSAPHATFADNGYPAATTNDRRPAFAAAADADIDQYRFVITDSEGTEIDSQLSPDTAYTPSVDLADGDYWVTLSGVDAAGNQTPSDQSESAGFTIDGTAPAVTFGEYAPADGSRTNATSGWYDFASDENGAYTCAIDDATPAACEPGDEFTGLADGLHAIHVTATDWADNSTTVTRSFTVDTVKPSVAIGVPTAGQVFTTAAATIAGTGSTDAHDHDHVSVVVVADNEMAQMTDFDGTAPIVDGKWTLTTSNLPNGKYVAYAIQNDAAGNEDVRSVKFEIAVPAAVQTAVVPPAPVTPPADQPRVTLPETPAAPTAGVVRSALTEIAGDLSKTLAKTSIQALLGSGEQPVSIVVPGAGVITIKLTTPIAVSSAAAKKKARTVVVATGSRTVGAAGPAKVKVKLTPAGRKLLKRSKRVRLTVSTSFTAKGTKVARTVTRKATVKRHR